MENFPKIVKRACSAIRETRVDELDYGYSGSGLKLQLTLKFSESEYLNCNEN